MTASFLVAVDPGLDAAGVAVFDLRNTCLMDFKTLAGDHVTVTGTGWHPRESFHDVMKRLTRYEVLRTHPDWPLPRRLGSLAAGLQALVPEGAAHVILERSRIPGVYARARARQQSKNAINAGALEKLFFAIGALTAGAYARTAPVDLVPAPVIAKQIRQKVVLYELRRLNHPLGLKARPSPDLLDAIYLGASWLTHPERKELAA